MNTYGQIIENIEFEKENFYSLITSYFDNIELVKIKNENKCSIYMSRILTMLKDGNRYIIAIVPQDNNPIDTRVELKDLNWICFQTRILDDYHNIPRNKYTVKRSDEFNSKIRIKNRNQTESEYTSDLYDNINITLLHQKKSEYEYPNEGTISAALETFRTIITFNS